MTKPGLFIFTGADRVTGALIAGFSQESIIRDTVNVTLVMSTRTGVIPNQWPVGSIVLLPLARAGKSLGSLLLYPFALLRSGWCLHRALKRAGCKRLQINDFHFAEGAVVRLLGFGGQIVTWVRIDPQRYGLVGRIWLALARWSSDELVAVSKFIAGQLPSNYRSTVIYNSAPPVGKSHAPSGQQLLFVGNYIEGKGQAEAIQAFHRIAVRFPNVEMVFHGSDMGLDKNRAYRATLERLAIDGPGQARIHLRDFLDNLDAIYGEAFAALNFSHSESFSLTCLEASAHGLAVLATRCGGPEEIVDDGVTGYLVAVGDVEAMAARMADLLGDRARTAAMGQAGRRTVNERFSPGKFREQVLEIFDLN